MSVTIVDIIVTRRLKMIVYRKIKYEEMKVLYQYKEVEEHKCTKTTTQYRT